MAVRLAIRPRLKLPAEPVAKLRRGPRLPPLTIPAVIYWIGMGALTYGFTQLGENPLQAASLSLDTGPAQLEMNTEPPLPSQPEPGSAPGELPEPPPRSSAPALAALAPEVDRAWEPERQRESEPLAARERGPESRVGAERERMKRSSDTLETLARRSTPETAPAPLTALDASPAARLTFPDFTDSSRPAERERASSGPRIDSDLFAGSSTASAGPSAEKPASDGSAAASPDSAAPALPVGSSCEAAIARNNEEIRIGAARGAADLTRNAYASILENGRYLAGCSVPDRTVFEVCAAVQGGRAVGITVVSNPSNARLNACVRRAVSHLKFPESARLDVTRTRFDAVRRER